MNRAPSRESSPRPRPAHEARAFAACAGLPARETKELSFSPPARMPLGLFVAAVTAGGRLRVAFCYRLAAFGPQAAAEFAELYLFLLRRLAGPVGGSPTPEGLQA